MGVRRHTIYNLLGALLPLAASLATTPFYLRLVGEERYGFLAIAWLLLGYFGLFDFGLSRATAQRIAAIPDAEHPKRAITFWTALVMNLGLGVIGALVLWPVGWYLVSFVLQLDPGLRREASEAMPWLALGVPLTTVTAVLSGTLQGRARFLELNLITATGMILFQLIPLAAAALIEPTLGIVLPVAVAVRLLPVGALLLRCWQHVGKPAPPYLSTAEAAHLLRFGGWVSITSLVSPLMVILDRVVLGIISGPRAVSHYTIPFQLTDRSTLLAQAMSSALFPKLASVSEEEARHLGSQGIQTLLLLITPIMVIAILAFRPFLQLWISHEFASEAALVGEILLVGWWMNSFARVPYALLQARGRPDLVAKCHLIEIVPYFAALSLGLYLLGLPGAAIAFSLRVMVDFFALSYLAGTLPYFWRQLPVPLVFIVAALGICILRGADFSHLLMLSIGLIMAAVLWSFFMTPQSMFKTIMMRAKGRM